MAKKTKAKKKEIKQTKSLDSYEKDFIQKFGEPNKLKKIDFAKDKPVDYVSKFHDLSHPIFLMNFPFTLHNNVPNNVWVEEEHKAIDLERAWVQWLDLYSFLANLGLVYVLPSGQDLQDLVYVANLGMALPYEVSPKTVILSNFRSAPRVGEEIIGKQFFSAMNFTTYQCPVFWEGSADTKFLYTKDGVSYFLGGYGIRTDQRAYSWMMDTFKNIQIIPIKMWDEYLYHFDCNVFPIDIENTLVNVNSFEKKDLKNIEKYTNIISITEDDAYGGTCNSVMANGVVLNASSISTMKRTNKYYEDEIKRINKLTKICNQLGKELATFNLSEYEKSGAMLSCCIMHLNYFDFQSSSINNNTKKIS